MPPMGTKMTGTVEIAGEGKERSLYAIVKLMKLMRVMVS